MKVSSYGSLLRAELAAQPVTRRCCRIAEAVTVLQVSASPAVPLSSSALDDAILRRLRILLGPQVSLPLLPARLNLLDHAGRRIKGLPTALATRSGLCCATAICRGAILCEGDLRPGRSRLRLIIDFPAIEIAVAVAGTIRRLGTTTQLRPHGDDEGEGERLRVDNIAPLLRVLNAVDTLKVWAQRERHRTLIREPGINVDGHLRQLNAHRSRQAAARVSARVSAALATLGTQLIPPELAQAGQLRLRHPQASLSELAALADPPLTKDTIGGRLRRLIALAEYPLV